MKKTIAYLLAAIMLIGALAGCSNQNDEGSSAVEGDLDSSSEAQVEDLELPQLADTTTVYEEPVLKQLEAPPVGNPTVTLHTTKGDVTLVLYPEEAPNAVNNFLTHAEEGYYTGQTFHRVISGFMAQGGDPTASSTGGESIWGNHFQDEFSDNLHNFRGALSMANGGANTNGSQFFIVQKEEPASVEDHDKWMLNMYMEDQTWIATTALQNAALNGASEESLNQMIEELNNILNGMIASGVPENQQIRFEKAIETYQTMGGTPQLDYKHTVFGQVIEGMDVVDAICAMETNEKDKPLEDVTIQSVTVGKVQ